MEYKLCESEYRFMTIIWDNEPVGSGELVKLCNKELGWKKSTTYTVLKKLTERGFTENNDFVIRSLVARQDVQRFASADFVDRTFKGSLPNFLAAFFDGKHVSDSEIEELKKIIDNHQNKDSE